MRFLLPSSLLLLACGGAVTPPPAVPPPPVATKTWSPSFNCEKASTPTEHRICESEALSALDRNLAEAWKAANAAHPGQKDSFKQQQRNWLKGNADCNDDPCLAARYQERIGFLKGIAAIPEVSDNFTGTWQDGENTVAVLQRDRSVEYNLQAFRILSEENVHMGFAHGTGELNESSFSNHPDDTTGCTLRFQFDADTLTLTQDGSDADCGFGVSVYAGGTYHRVNHTPDMAPPG